MSMSGMARLVALQFSNVEIAFAIFLALVLMVVLWGPYLYEEIVRGKATLGPRIPDGAGDTHPGRRGDPAPGQPDAQADPYDPKAQR
jgi:hypothetical protein